MRWKRKILTETEKEILRNLYLYISFLCVCASAIDLYTTATEWWKESRFFPFSSLFFSSYIIYTEDVCIERKEAELTVSKSTKDVSLLSSQIAKICLYILFWFPLTIHVNVRGTTTSEVEEEELTGNSCHLDILDRVQSRCCVPCRRRHHLRRRRFLRRNKRSDG